MVPPGQGRLLGCRDQARAGAGPAAYPVFTHKHHTDVVLPGLRARSPAGGAGTRSTRSSPPTTPAPSPPSLQMAARYGAAFELQRLHGMGEGVGEVTAKCCATRWWPAGSMRRWRAPRPAGLPVRRLLENGANSSFVHQLADESVGMDELLTLAVAAGVPGRCQPAGGALRRAAQQRGVDLTRGGAARAAACRRMADPAGRVVPRATRPRCRRLAASRQPFAHWRQTWFARHGAAQRGHGHGGAAAAAARAAGARGLQDLGRRGQRGARGGRDPALLRPPRPSACWRRWTCPAPPARPTSCAWAAAGLVCISPGTSLLAIFTGQVARPWPPATRCWPSRPSRRPPSRRAAVALQAAGVPADALQLLHGPGETAGAALVGPGVAGVVFTGSTEVARIIHARAGGARTARSCR